MINIIRTLIITAAACTFALAGCENKDAQNPSEQSTAPSQGDESSFSTPTAGADEQAEADHPVGDDAESGDGHAGLLQLRHPGRAGGIHRPAAGPG